MGYGPVVNGKHTPITPWAGSWAATINTKSLAGLKPEQQFCRPFISTEQQREDQKILKDADYFLPYDYIPRAR